MKTQTHTGQGSPNTVDLIIVGGGASGLSLAVHLLDAGYQGELLVLDRRETFEEDRTFCNFRVDPHPFESCVVHRYPRWRVRDHGAGERGWITRTSERHPYERISSLAFYLEGQRRIREAKNARLLLSATVSEVRGGSGSAEVIATVAGAETRFRAPLVFDSRPAELLPSDTALIQHFEGWFIETRDAVFDPEVATLMDFDVPGCPASTHFLYVLPDSPTSALIEDTYFTKTREPDVPYEATLLRACSRYGEYRVTRKERGVLPMSVGAPAPAPRGVTRIGLAGGAAKPASGYVFSFIQRWSAAIAEAVVAGQPIPKMPRNARTRALDDIFLAELAARPHVAPGLFTAMFDRVPVDMLVRFLNERSSPRDELSIMRALPASPMVKRALALGARRAFGHALRR